MNEEAILPDDYADRPAFDLVAPANTNTLADPIGQAIAAANTTADAMAAAERDVLTAARRHLMLSIGLGGILENVYQLCARERLSYTGLFSDRQKAASPKLLKLTGGMTFRITYACGNNYRNLYNQLAERIRAAAPVSEDEVNAMLTAHTCRLMAGGYDDPAAANAQLFGGYLGADSLRQAMLELMPPKETKSALDAVAEAIKATPANVDFEARRSQYWAEWGSFSHTLDSYIAEKASQLNAADREAAAVKLEAAAAALRATKTQPMLPWAAESDEQPATANA